MTERRGSVDLDPSRGTDMEDPTPGRHPLPFDPELSLARLPRAMLAVLGREWLLHGHLQDRIGMPLAHAGRPREEMQAIAIDEWMAVSPVYTRRVQGALRFEGDGVDTIFKALQLDIGAPHQFLDVRFALHDREHGEFWLAHCGALMDVEPMGEDYTHGMCHTIEDPTFDATAVATNPRAQVRPLHRPPRAPADREPHCHWTVTIDEAHAPVAPHPGVAIVEDSVAARCAVDDPGAGTDPGGWDDYSGPFDPDFQLEDLSQRALVIALQEVAIQSHLLIRGYCLALAARADDETATATAARMAVGLGGVTAERLSRAFALDEGAPGLAALLQIHPFFWPRTYVHPVIALDGDRVRFALAEDSPAFTESDDFTWLASMAGDTDRAVTAIARGFDRRAVVERVRPRAGERCAYQLSVDPTAEPAAPDQEVSLTKFSSGAAFELAPRRPVRA
jgi:hypothetical protein